MRLSPIVSAAALLLAATAPAAKAGLILTVEAGLGVDPNNLVVGQTYEFQVSLSGVVPSSQIDYLAGTVYYDGTLFGTATAITAGSIVPVTTPPDFIGSTPNPDEVDGSYVAASVATTITGDGVFFTFKVKAEGPGSGKFDFNFVDVGGFGMGGEPLQTADIAAGAPLDFTIKPSAVPVPGPVVLTLVGAPFAFGFRRLAGRRLAAA